MIRIAAQQFPFPAGSRASIVRLLVCAAMLAAALSSAPASAAPPKGGAANLAMIGEPQTLDPMASTADLVGTIMQHVYELLYTYDANSNVVPMLAESMPTVSKDGLVYTIPLRVGVKFHNGKEMTSADVRGVAGALDGDGAARQGGRQGDQVSRGQGREFDRHHAQPSLCAAGRAPGIVERLRGDHGQGFDRHAAYPVRRHRSLHVQGAQA